MSRLTTDQIQDLAAFVLEECGFCLSDDELTDEIGLRCAPIEEIKQEHRNSKAVA
jgi:glutaredoxin